MPSNIRGAFAAAVILLSPIAAGARDATPPAGSGSHRLQARFDAANSTHDGHLTLAQAQAGGMRGVVRHFEQIDLGHKGFVTLGDVRQYARGRRAARMSQTPATDAQQ